MATHPEPDDLDRTDELPQLDVVAYEARARESIDPLSATDTWLVESIPEADSAENLPPALAISGRPTRPLISGSADLSINIDRLQRRIAALESELGAARVAAVDDEAQRLGRQTAYADLESRLTALAADNDRLREQQQIAQALTDRLQQQLRDLAETHRAQLEEVNAAHDADRAAAEQQRHSLEQQLERSSTSYSGAADQHAKLQLALEESVALAASRARQVDELQRALVTEHGKADTLGRNLAAKIADYEIVSSLVAQRNATIAALERMRDALQVQIDRANANADTLTQQLAEANRRASEADRTTGELAIRDGHVTQLGSEIERLTLELQRAGEAQRDGEQVLMDLRVRHTSLGEQHKAVSDELDLMRTMAQSLTVERDQLLPMREQLNQRSSEIETLSAELATVRRDAASMWAELGTQSEQSRARTAELATAQQTIEELRASDTALRHALDEAHHNIQRLHAVSHDDTELLNERTSQLAAARQEAEARSAELRGLEHSLRARDKLIEDLRGEIRTTQDERSIMSEQLGKARARVKSMTQQIFNRDNRIAVLKADLAVHTEALAAIRRDVDCIDPESPVAPREPPERILAPVNHNGDPIVLNRRVMTIGRTNDNDIFIPSKMISRHHARLLVGPNAVIVEDAGSTNGCFVNDQQVKQHVLRDDDVLTIGDLKFRLVSRASGAVSQVHSDNFDADIGDED
ncbi:MAG TPA: FHA domain-containing protein [Povalibacter sp.]